MDTRPQGDEDPLRPSGHLPAPLGYDIPQIKCGFGGGLYFNISILYGIQIGEPLFAVPLVIRTCSVPSAFIT